MDSLLWLVSWTALALAVLFGAVMVVYALGWAAASGARRGWER